MAEIHRQAGLAAAMCSIACLLIGDTQSAAGSQYTQALSRVGVEPPPVALG